MKPGGGENGENVEGKDLGGIYGYLEGVFGNPSLVRKSKENKKKKKEKYIIHTCGHSFFLLT